MARTSEPTWVLHKPLCRSLADRSGGCGEYTYGTQTPPRQCQQRGSNPHWSMYVTPQCISRDGEAAVEPQVAAAGADEDAEAPLLHPPAVRRHVPDRERAVVEVERHHRRGTGAERDAAEALERGVESAFLPRCNNRIGPLDRTRLCAGLISPHRTPQNIERRCATCTELSWERGGFSDMGTLIMRCPTDKLHNL
eukprot:gene753-biopygen16682